MRLPLPMALDHGNVYALDDGAGWSLVDAGLDSRRTRALRERRLAGPLAGKPVTRVLVPRHHFDHIGPAGWFQPCGTELLTTRTAWLLARLLLLDAQPRPMAEQLAFWRAAGMDDATLARRATERPFNFADCVMPLPLGVTRIDEDETITLGQRRWQVRFGPGDAGRHVRQVGDDVFRDAVGELFLLRIAAHVCERQYGDRRLV